MKQDNNTTVVLRVSIEKDYTEDFDGFKQDPKKRLQKWVEETIPGPTARGIRDAWGFNHEQRYKGEAIVGLTRVQTAEAAALLRYSGHRGVFIDATLPLEGLTMSTVWVDKEQGDQLGVHGEGPQQRRDIWPHMRCTTAGLAV